MTVANDETYQEAKELEDRLFKQRQIIEKLPNDSPLKSRFDETWKASLGSLHRQESLEKTFGTSAWTAMKIRAMEGNKKARCVFNENLSVGIVA